MSTKTNTLAALPSMPSKNRSKSIAPRQCGCGCGLLTKGGNYIPGHDARLLGWAIRIDRGFDVTGISAGELKAAKAFIAGHDAKFDRHFPGGRKHGEAVGKGKAASKAPRLNKRKAAAEAALDAAIAKEAIAGEITASDAAAS